MLRIASVFVSLTSLLALTGLLAPASFAAAVGDLRVTIVANHQPADAGAGDLITHVPFDNTPGATGFVQVLVEKVTAIPPESDPIYAPVGDGEAEVKFRLANADDPNGAEPDATGTLTVAIERTDASGIATFDTSLSIAETNNLSDDYRIVPQARYASEITLLEVGWPFEGSASTGFDIWDDACHGAGCDVSLRDGGDTYVAQQEVGMAASELIDSTHITCKGQREIFANDLFFHVTTSTDGSDAVKLTSFITADDFRAAGTNFGQAHVDWCVGLESRAPWRALGVKPTTQSFGGTTFFVALAPRCPSKKQMPPCILSRMSDGAGGAIVTGWLPGGDPPRRT